MSLRHPTRPLPPAPDLSALLREEALLQDRLLRAQEEGDHEQVSAIRARLSEILGAIDRAIPW